MNSTIEKGCVFFTSLAIFSCAFVFCACEHSSHGDDDHYPDNANEIVQKAKKENHSSSKVNNSSTSGTWGGKSSTSQVKSKLSLREKNGSISGTLYWPNDRRSVSGSRNGSSVILHIQGGDVWKMQFKGSSMSGTGYKAGTSTTYRLGFKRS